MPLRLLTIDNGPFDIVTNDELMWMHEIELPDFMANFEEILSFLKIKSI